MKEISRTFPPQNRKSITNAHFISMPQLNSKLDLYSPPLQYLSKQIINKNTKMDANNIGFYYIPYPYAHNLPLMPLNLYPEKYLEFLISEEQRLKLQQEVLVSELQNCSEQKSRIQEENTQLREVVSRSESRIKRRYRKRRTWLEKKYRCNVKGCSSKYSSKIALNSHKRKKHPKKGKTMI